MAEAMTTQLDEIKNCLAVLLPRGDCVLTYDQSLVDQLPDILRENFRITSAFEASRLTALDRLINLLLPNRRDELDMASLPKLLYAVGIDKADYAPRPPASVLQENEETFSHWAQTSANEDINAVLTLQKDLGMGQYNPTSERHTARWERGNSVLRHYLRGVTTVPPNLIERLMRSSYWELRIKWWKLRGWLDGESPSLSIGPRWVTEIEFFRQILGLRRHVGLDLFSNDQDLVKVGDMHQMPFPDQHFQLVFIKNTVDKSYDVRRLVAELLRVTRPGGIIVVDQICGYGNCSPLTRTDIQKSENLLRLFRVRSPVQVLVQMDIDLSKALSTTIQDRSRNNARLAIRVPN
jgi:hypothetical protein